MKKKNLSLTMFVAACAGLLLAGASCKKGDDGITSATGAAFTATIEAHTGDSKTMLSDNHVFWQENDRITVYSATTGTPDHYTFSATEVDGSKTEFTSNGVPGSFYISPYNAFYPVNETYDKNASKWAFTLPATQMYSVNGFAPNTNPMAVCSNDNTLHFKNVCGLLELKLWNKDAVNVKKITVTSNESSDYLSGTGSVSIDSDDNPMFNFDETGTDKVNSVMLDCGRNGVQLSTEEEAPTRFCIVLPAGSLWNGFTVKVEGDNLRFEKKAEAVGTNGIMRNNIVEMPSLKCTFVETDVFTVGMDGVNAKKVRFSKGNLYWDNNKYNFEKNQYDYRMYNGLNNDRAFLDNEQTTTPLNTVGMFFWVTAQQSTKPYDKDYGTPTPANTLDDKLFTEAEDFVVNDESGWRTLTNVELSYLFNFNNSFTSGRQGYRFAKAQVKGINGLLIFPDAYDGIIEGDGIATVNDSELAFPETSILDDIWASMEQKNVVFLPAAGNRLGSTCWDGFGEYWLSTTVFIINEYLGERLFFTKDKALLSMEQRVHGGAIRLVRDVL